MLISCLLPVPAQSKPNQSFNLDQISRILANIEFLISVSLSLVSDCGPSSAEHDPYSRPRSSINNSNTPPGSADSGGDQGCQKQRRSRAGRVRTVLTEKQLSLLKSCYAANPRPDALMKEQLVEMTGLSPRVVRVWFQNKRCKDKKKLSIKSGKVRRTRACVFDATMD